MWKKSLWAVGATCLVFLVLSMLPPQPRVTKANFDHIKNGMTKDAVERILGKPTMKVAYEDITSAWGDGSEEADAVVWYDAHQIVRLKAWLRERPETFWEKTLQWFPWLPF